MEQRPTTNVASPKSPQENAKPKQTWHNPTVTFVPLNATAFNQGSPTDGNTGSTSG